MSPVDVASDPMMLPTHVVGVGASTGGLEAIERLFRSIPVRTGMAFVIVQHLSPDFKSLMDELLARWTTMTVHRVEEGMQVEANHIYLIPPKMEIFIEGNQLRLVSKKPKDGLSLPIDVFFKSLAREWRSRSIAIVLSGTGSDGSRGIREVREAGGLVISQSLETAKFDGMPKSAERTGVVDMVLSPEDIAGTLDLYASLPTGEKSLLLEKPVIVGDRSMNRLLRLLHEECGIDFLDYKRATVQRRIERRVLLSQSLDFEQYIERVFEDREELNSLYKDLLIGVTHFFRDASAFERLRHEILPDLLGGLEPGDQFRAWIAGCATGEEAYSFAIIVSEILEDLNLPLDVKIFATDVHRNSLDVASAGIYSEQSLRDVSSERKRRCFFRTARGYQLTPELRQMIVFAPHNVMVDAPFTKLDFVSCRNMLIYFQPDAQTRVISSFHFALKKDGVLLLGPSETLGELAVEFATLDGHWKIYRKTRDVRLNRDLNRDLNRAAIAERSPSRMTTRLMNSAVSAGPVNSSPVSPSPVSPSPVSPSPVSPSPVSPSLVAAYNQLLEHHMPAGVLLDSHRQLVQLFGDAVKYVQLRPGRPINDALDWFAPSLRAAAVGAVHRVSRELEPVHINGLRLSDEDDSQVLRMGVQPLVSKEGELAHIMITFEPVAMQLHSPSPEVRIGEMSVDPMGILERELRVIRNNLQTTIEELEASNEELQATNEELVASNEELQSTNEELHSVNEELYTVNGEFQKNISELTELSDDLNHLFENLEAGLMFLDADLHIRKFTPSVASIFSLLPQDVGRSFESFSHRLECPGLTDDVKAVFEIQTPCERELRIRDGQWFSVRMQPYRSGGRVDGVVLEIFEITHAMQAAQVAAIANGCAVTSAPFSLNQGVAEPIATPTATVTPIRNDSGSVDAVSVRLNRIS